MQTPVIRPATVADVPTLSSLYAELDGVHQRQFPEMFAASVKRDAGWIEKAVGEEHIGYFVAELECDGAVVCGGFVRVTDVRTPEGIVLLSRRFGLVDDLVVAERYRRMGIASALLRTAEAWAIGRGIGALEVSVWAFNQAAQELYASQGFGMFRHYLRKSLER